MHDSSPPRHLHLIVPLDWRTSIIVDYALRISAANFDSYTSITMIAMVSFPLRRSSLLNGEWFPAGTSVTRD